MEPRLKKKARRKSKLRAARRPEHLIAPSLIEKAILDGSPEQIQPEGEVFSAANLERQLLKPPVKPVDPLPWEDLPKRH